MLKKYFLLIGFLCFEFIFIGCTNTNSTTTHFFEPTDNPTTIHEELVPESIVIKEPEAEVNDFVVFSAFHITSEETDIYFDVDINSIERDEMLKSILKMIEIFPYAKGTSYIIGNQIGNWIDNNTIHLNALDFYNHNNYFCFTLLLYYGKMSNFGLIYGYSQYLLNQTSEIAYQDISDITVNNEYLFDLSWPLFLSEYVTEDISDAARSISTMFVSYLIETQGEVGFTEFLVQSGSFDIQFDVNLSSYLTQWLSSISIQYTVIPVEEVIRYSTVSSQYPVMIETINAKYYFCEGYLGTGIYGVTISNYQEVIEYIETTESQMAMVREFVDNDLSIDLYGKIPIYHVLRVNSSDDGGIYLGNGENSKIIVKYIGATLHEYVHYATIGTKYSEASAETKAYLSEGIATYITGLYDKYGIETFYSEYLICILSPPDNLVTFITNYESYLEQNEMEFNMLDYIDCYVYTFGEETTYPNYYTSMSFIRYLIDNYGIELFLKYFGEVDTFDNLYGQNRTTMMDDWYTSIIQKFQDN
jgi:hypothetical protein